MNFTTEQSRHVFITAVFKEIKKLAKLRSRDLTSFKEFVEEKIDDETSSDIPNFLNVVFEVFDEYDLDEESIEEDVMERLEKASRTFAISNFHRFFRDVLVGIYVDEQCDDDEDSGNEEDPDVPDDVVADIEAAIEGYVPLEIESLKELSTYDIITRVREFANNELDQEKITRENVDRSIPSFYGYLDFDEDEMDEEAEEDNESVSSDSDSSESSEDNSELAAILDSKIDKIRDLNGEVSELRQKSLAYEQTIQIQRISFDEMNAEHESTVSTLRTLYSNAVNQNIFLKQSILVFISSLVLAYYNIQK